MLHESIFKLALAGRKDGETMKLQHFPSEHRNHAAVDIDYLPINKIRSSRTQEHRGADWYFREEIRSCETAAFWQTHLK